MSSLDPPPPLCGAIVTEVTLVDRLERQERGAFQSDSLPGHLIHVCVSGEVEQRSGGVTQRFEAGDAVWYYENEPVQGSVLTPPWIFYTVNFQAPSLLPPPLPQRVCSAGPNAADRMVELLDVWRSTELPETQRHLRVHAILYALIADLLPTQSQHHRIDDSTQAWWQLEVQLRGQLDQPIDLNRLEQLSGRSQRHITRACRLATGLSPMKRVKQIRLSYARGLTQLSDLSMTEISMRIGYTRVQEFSRDYHAAFGCTPSQDRLAGPDYRQSKRSSQR
ncbi:AraC family transcriptional regulator [Rhodopirellula sp. JC740]|uniref:AraC family transcriptional regulator n=1 Tax=Rhodopirellula halodulae TaxID=2894198 RepID=A0ABS8NG19_9BACT|nr:MULTISPECIES: AraC family transcriptional regulator [unclassified Rhodopirellula]MCC9642486.1 AraC family transcriptional regulator [Rhodopirellula sp. JC740]MCC9654557.1 AraC family transcriptional regulator [Rhodopirellula sp. JC737]